MLDEPERVHRATLRVVVATEHRVSQRGLGFSQLPGLDELRADSLPTGVLGLVRGDGLSSRRSVDLQVPVGIVPQVLGSVGSNFVMQR